MRPSVTVLQLDTQFPRIAGDVACPATYRDPVEVILIPHASVARVVSRDPGTLDIAPFIDAVTRAKGDVIVTSCGFLAPFQDVLARASDRPLIASALNGYANLIAKHPAGDIPVMTFDAGALRHQLPDATLIGLPETAHLRQVITADLDQLDPVLAARDIARLWAENARPSYKHLLLECTNLPPYKAAIRRAADIDISDILTQIEAIRPNTIAPVFL